MDTLPKKRHDSSKKVGPPLPKAVYSFHPKKNSPSNPTNQSSRNPPPKANRCCAEHAVQLETSRVPLQSRKRLLSISSDPVLSTSSHSGLNHSPSEIIFFLLSQSFPHSSLSLLFLFHLWCLSEEETCSILSELSDFGESNTAIGSCPLFFMLNKHSPQPLFITCHHMLVINQTFC